LPPQASGKIHLREQDIDPDTDTNRWNRPYYHSRIREWLFQKTSW